LAFLARLDERERTIAALIAMCLLAGLVVVAMHGQLASRSASLEQGSLAAPLNVEQLHETAGAGATPPDAALGTGGAGDGSSGGGDGSPGTTPPNTPPQQPPEEPQPPDDNLIQRLLNELPIGPPPPPRSHSRSVRGRR
jgi:hypothetical protein